MKITDKYKYDKNVSQTSYDGVIYNEGKSQEMFYENKTDFYQQKGKKLSLSIKAKMVQVNENWSEIYKYTKTCI